MTGGARFDGEIRQVAPPLGPQDLTPLEPHCTMVHFASRLSDDDMRLLADFLAGYPDVGLRVYGGYDQSIADLDFLRFFPRLRKFSVDAIYELSDLEGIRPLPTELEKLVIGRTRSKSFSLRTLTRVSHLRELYLEGHQKDIEAIGRLTSLEDLTLRSITVPDLSALLPLTGLVSLDIKLGGTRDLGLLPHIGRLDRKNADAWDMLPLGPKPFNYEKARARSARGNRG